ncbi:hypothetical protein [Streptomyces sp. NPDC017529]|uniref:hypothetical protein n=1 Tax=Streptomyces sp. NPDC017529 TaxID=3365000 RepID=UPI0037BBFF32
MTDASPTKPFVLRKRSAPEQIRYDSRKTIEFLKQIAHDTPGDHRYTLLAIAGILDRVADEIEQQQADTAGEYLALAQHTDTTCEAAAALNRVRALHTRNEDAGYCDLCADHGDVDWPCATIAALTPSETAAEIEQPFRRSCLFAGCLRQFDAYATMSGHTTEPDRSAKGWKQVRPTVASGYVCPDHADTVEQHRPRWTERQRDTVALTCVCGWMSPMAIWQGYAVAAWQDHLLRPNATQCKVCKHPADQHTESDEPVSVGKCRTCAAQGDEDDAWHDYEPTQEA